MSAAGGLHAQGKVRDVFDAGPDALLLVATDRISAFDVVLPDPVPDKGRVLTAFSLVLVRADERIWSPTTSSRPTAAAFPAPFDARDVARRARDARAAAPR